MTKFTVPTAKTILAVAALVLAPSIASSCVHAEAVDGRETVSTAVSYADLNLSSPQGQATMKARIAAAVTNVCGTPDNNLMLRMEINKCRTKAMHDAYAAVKINQPVFASR